MTGDAIDRRILSAFYGSFVDLTEIQQQAAEPIVTGEDVIVSAATGAGKTEAVIVPLLSRYYKHLRSSEKPVIIYISPTKALINDLEKRLRLKCAKISIEIGIRHGDRSDLEKKVKPQLLITTPESLEVLLYRKDGLFDDLEAVIVDEAHLFYNTQRGFQLSMLLRRIAASVNRQLQRIALSATIADPEALKCFLFGQGDCCYINCAGSRIIDAQVRIAKTLDDLRMVISTLFANNDAKILLFVSSRAECERIAGFLQQDEAITHSLVIHYSTIDHEQRVKNEDFFSRIKPAVCIATSTLELGIDIGDIDLVVLWGVPWNMSSFLQRIGRTNRRSNKTNVLCFVEDQSENVVRDVLLFQAQLYLATQGVVSRQDPFNIYGAIIQQLLSLVLTAPAKMIKRSDLLLLFKDFNYLDENQLDDILSHLVATGYLSGIPSRDKYGVTEKAYELIDKKIIYGNFPESIRKVGVYSEKKRLGEVPGSNHKIFKTNDKVFYLGKKWRITRTDKKGFHLIPAVFHGRCDTFHYGGIGLGMEPFIADSVWKFIVEKKQNFCLNLHNNNDSVDTFLSQLDGFDSRYMIPCRIVDGMYYYYVFCGLLINNVIAGYSRCSIGYNDDLMLVVDRKIDFASLPEDLSVYTPIVSKILENTDSASFFQKLLPARLYIDEALQSWLKDKAIAEIFSRLIRSEVRFM